MVVDLALGPRAGYSFSRVFMSFREALIQPVVIIKSRAKFVVKLSDRQHRSRSDRQPFSTVWGESLVEPPLARCRSSEKLKGRAIEPGASC
jgi:large-conductance mechanosensitive channel